MSPLVSVIVPVYNVEKYLRQCLNSLLEQTYENIEVIMVDDGSQDSSGEICNEYAAKYANYFVVHKENAGLGMARNTGMKHMQGEYVTFLDSDDYLDQNCIEVLYNNLLKYHVDMCKGGFKRVENSGNVISRREYQEQVFEGEMAKRELLPRMIGSSPRAHDSVEMCVCGAIYKCESIKKYDLKFPSERELISEDLVFNIDYMQHANGACTIEDMGYNYRVNLKSLSTSYRPDRFEASRHFYLTMQSKLQGLEYDEETMLRLDRMFFVYLKMCVAQERKKISYGGKAKSIENIRIICTDKTVMDVIDKYPRKLLGIKQRAFLLMLRKQMARTLYLIARMKKL